jgi:hypothetical protein
LKRIAGHVGQMGKTRNTCSILVWKPFGKCPLERKRDGRIILIWILRK